MWQVTLTAVDPKNAEHTEDTTFRIYSDGWEDLLANQYYKWGTLEAMLRNGSLKRIHIDYRPNFGGSRRVRMDNNTGLYYVWVDGVRFGSGRSTREEAWEECEGIVRAASAN